MTVTLLCHLTTQTVRQTPAVRVSPVHCVTHRSVVLYNNNKMQSETANYAPGAATWQTERNVCIVLDSGTFAVLFESITSSTKPEVHDVLQCRQGRTEPHHR